MNAYAGPLAENDRILSRVSDVAYPAAMTSEIEDSALMLRYGDGDLAAFDALYRRHKDGLYRYLLRLSLHREHGGRRISGDLGQDHQSSRKLSANRQIYDLSLPRRAQLLHRLRPQKQAAHACRRCRSRVIARTGQ